MTRHNLSPGRLAALAMAAAMVAACSADADDGASSGESAPTSSPSSAPTTSPPGDLVRATRLTDVASDARLTPGTYAMGVPSDQADELMVLIDVPAGYRAGSDGYEIGTTHHFRHFDSWTVAEVATEPCGDTDWVEPGPSVDDLADALAALPVWETTRPAPRTIGGHEGVFMELNLPAHLPATCPDDPFSWRDHLGGTQGISSGKTQLVWIVDVDGQRVMLLGGYFPGPEGPTPSQVEDLTQMAEGATFVDDSQVAP